MRPAAWRPRQRSDDVHTRRYTSSVHPLPYLQPRHLQDTPAPLLSTARQLPVPSPTWDRIPSPSPPLLSSTNASQLYLPTPSMLSSILEDKFAYRRSSCLSLLSFFQMIVNRCLACDIQHCVRIAQSRTFHHCHDYCTCTYRLSGGGCCGECILSHWPHYCWHLLSIFSSQVSTDSLRVLSYCTVQPSPVPVLTVLMFTVLLHVLCILSDPHTPTLPDLQRSSHYCHSRSH